MIVGPYSEYRDSGLQWLGAIPAHWDLVRTKHLFTERVEKGFPDERLLAATQTKGVVPKEQYENRTVVAMKDLHLLKLVEKGDYVISLRSFQGGIEYAHIRGIISPAYTILKSSSQAKPDYFRFFFKSRSFVDALTLFVTGIRQGQNIDYTRLSREPLPVPSEEEQIKIGRFLRPFVAKINQFIRIKQDLIRLLNEQKQTIIHHAVTRGLDPNVRLKPSGVDWLGDVPEHWDVTKLRHVVNELGGMTPSKANTSFWNGSIPWVSPKDMKVDELADTLDHISEAALEQTGIQIVEPPAVLVVVRGMILARSFPVSLTTEPLTINQDMKALIPKSQLRADFLSFVLRGHEARILNLVEESGHGTKCLHTAIWRNLSVPIPRNKIEQEEIVVYLKSELSSLNRKIRLARDKIDQLYEYRARLISDVVTGKLDVRGVELSALDGVDTDGLETPDSPDDIPADTLDETEELVYADD